MGKQLKKVLGIGLLAFRPLIKLNMQTDLSSLSFAPVKIYTYS